MEKINNKFFAKYTHKSRIDNRYEIRSLVNYSGNDIVIRYRNDLRRRCSMLFTYHVQYRFLYMQQYILQSGHVSEPNYKKINFNADIFYHRSRHKRYLHQLIRIQTLHLDYFVVTSSIVKRITSFRKII